jgi:hypothetical protein
MLVIPTETLLLQAHAVSDEEIPKFFVNRMEACRQDM